MNNPTILIIDDENQIRKLLEITLTANGFKVNEAATGKDGIISAATHPPDMILLDLGLPDEDGQNILKKLREWYKAPIMILSVKNNEDDIVKALDNGANDYLSKPFRTGELLARIRSALRLAQNIENIPLVEYGNLSIDFNARIVKKNQEVLKLTSTEYQLLTLMAQNESRVLTHQFILKTVWGPSYLEQSQYLRVFVGQLRKKIEDNPNQPRFIITESGVGYRFVGGEIGKNNL
ncbi:KDP operon transcriptional regulatory protein KdpE [Emticicia aquatica]|uniref:KDP operon transcriptional regulatory protein KdpE n=1 Tax=Emticicia aquatica TaxID=1681835 RepID=A0ABM9AQ37_9BACT|nr:response regulator [Emticicia aquatica]CAH0995926.1 KDP operon transcriptional regulatory protein KdpE [Emticicia aquatica]